MIRHPDNLNLILHQGDTFMGLPLQTAKGPFVVSYLDRLYETICRAVDQYPRVFACRIDLRLPHNENLPVLDYENELIDRFFESLRAKIAHNRRMARRENKYAHDSVVRYVWAREVGQLGRPHYHLALFLNFDAYCALGEFTIGRANMFNRFQEAWASALRLPIECVSTLLYVPENSRYRICRGDEASIAKFFYRVSYLCKAATKSYGHGGHGFGASRS